MVNTLMRLFRRWPAVNAFLLRLVGRFTPVGLGTAAAEPVLPPIGQPFRPRPDLRLWTVLAAEHPSDNTESVSGGIDLKYREVVSLRAGYQNLLRKDSEEGLTAGVGLKQRLPGFDARLDYAWADFGRLEAVHRITLVFGF